MKLLYLLALCVVLASCGGGDTADPIAGEPDACSITSQRESLSRWMQDRYYWHAQLAQGDVGAADMDGYFQSMLPDPPDRYSYTQSTASYEQVFNTGWRIGYGYTLAWDDTGAALRVRNIEPGSPAELAGLKRGQRVYAIDGLTPQEVMAGKLPIVTTGGVERQFALADVGGAPRTVTVRSGQVMLTPLATWKTLDATRAGQAVKVGYMAYHQFVQYSAWQLALATSRMAGEGVSELVIDLRYNGGGAVATSRDLASMVSGSRTDGATFVTLRYNDMHPEQNLDLPFMTAADRYTAPIEGLSRVIVITSGNTASASELLINGLKPFMQVVLVGERTYGKPYGFMPHSECGITYNAVNFETFNALGEGGYSSGMPVDCPAADDLDHELGDAQERRLKEALAYIANGRCSAQAPQSAQIAPAKPRVFGEVVPPQMFYDR